MKNRIHNAARFISAGVCLLFSLLANHAGAALQGWNPNGTVSIGGNGTWDTSTKNWTPAGTQTQVASASLVAWTANSVALFCAGPAGSGNQGAFTITVNGAINCGGIDNGIDNPSACTLTLNNGTSGSLNLPSASTTFNQAGTACGSTTINVPITGVGPFHDFGCGGLILGATNTFTGGFQIAGTGGVSFGNNAVFGTGAITWQIGGFIQPAGSGAITITNAMTHLAGVIETFAGNSGGVTFSGPWTLPASGTVTIANFGTVANTLTVSGVISGAAGLTINTTTASYSQPWVFTGVNTYSGVTTITAGTLQLGDGATKNGSVAGSITDNASLIFANPNAQTYTKAISGTGTFTKQAAGVLTLSTAVDTYAGGTTISAGTLKLGIANVIPNGAGKDDVTLNGTLDLGSFACAINGLTGTGTVDNSTGAATYTLTAGNNAANSTFSGIIKNTSGTVALTKASTGMLTLANNGNTYVGATTVSGGTLQLGVDNAVPANSPVIVAKGAALDMNNLNDTIQALSGAGNVINNSATLTVNGNATPLNGQNFNGFSCIAGLLSGGGTLVKGGTHAMAFRGDNSSYSGPITFNAGTLSVGAAPNRLPTTMPLAIPSGALFQLDANNQTVATLNGSGSVNLGGGVLTVNQTGTDSFNGVIQNSELAGSSTALGHGLRGYYYTNVDMTVLAAVRDDSTVNIADVQNGLPGSLLPYKTNQISVRWVGKVLTTIAGQYVFSTKCDDGARLWVGGTLMVDDWTAHGALQRNGTNTLAANTQYDIVMEYFNNTDGGSAQLLWMPPGDTTSVIIPSSNLLLPGAGTFVMNGSGTQKLGGANTDSGGAVVNAGTLEVTAGGTLGSGNVTVNGGATLTLDSNSSIASAADLIVNSSALFVNLNYSGTDNIRALSLDGGATYQPVGTYGASASNPSGVFAGTGLIHVSAGSTTTTTLVSSPSSPATVVYGTTVTLTATVSGGATPSGTVTFYDGANWLGTGSLVSGVATLNVNNLLVEFSPHSLIAVYSGDATHAASTSAAATVTTTPETLVPTVIIANKVYDATTAATIASLAGMLPGDSNYVHVASYNATFSDKEAGTGKTVTIMNMVLAGSLAGEYTLSTAATNATANITPKALKVFNITAANKIGRAHV